MGRLALHILFLSWQFQAELDKWMHNDPELEEDHLHAICLHERRKLEAWIAEEGALNEGKVPFFADLIFLDDWSE